MSMLSFTSTSSINNHQVKNVSFSSYPSIDDDAFVHKVVTDTSRGMATTQEGHLDSARKEEEEDDGELRVFGAEKYFNGIIDEESPKHQLHQHMKEETTTHITKRHESASIQSASSWNSQSMLLQSAMRDTKLRSAKKSRGKRFLGSLSCKCVCSDKDSVDIAENDDVKSTRYNLVHAKPVITQDPIKTVHDHKERCFEKARKSLQVFGSKSRVVEEEIEFEDNGVVYESGSDASSDLFEIESLTGKATCYAPSEASIEWSVVTASAADFSALSDSEDHRFSPKAKPTKGIAQRRRPNLLLSCKSHKSVRVAGDAYVATVDKVQSPRTRHGSRPMIHVTRFEGGSKMIGFDSRQQHAFAKHHISRSHSPRASRLLYIQ